MSPSLMMVTSLYHVSLFYLYVLDAWSLDKKLDHIIHTLQIDEWKAGNKSGNTIKDSKMEKLETLIRILKNTTDLSAYCSKGKLIAW